MCTWYGGTILYAVVLPCSGISKCKRLCLVEQVSLLCLLKLLKIFECLK